MRPASHGSTGFFTTREMLRLSSAIFLLGIVGLMCSTGTAPVGGMTASNLFAEDSLNKSPQVAWTELVVKHHGHKDAVQIEALKAELKAVSDLGALSEKEMPAYWRLLKWAYAVPGEELRKQAQIDLSLADLMQKPSEYQGKLVDVNLDVLRILQHDAPENSANVTRVYEAWGVSEESQKFPYCMAFVDLPPDVMVEANTAQEARFVGFFLKNIAYEDSSGTKRSAPLLIGRMIVELPEDKAGVP